MAQNIYDDPDFHAGYSQLERSVHGLEGAAEWSELRGLLPALTNTRILDLGCGFGWFARWAREQRAASVLGLDVSEKMLERAASMTNDAAVAYRRADLESVDLPVAGFDLVFSSLAFHYIRHLDRLWHTAHEALVPGGWFVFSVEHPVHTAPSRPIWDAAQQAWLLDRYMQEGERRNQWLGAEVAKQHRTIATYLNLLIVSGFTIRRLIEWSPSEEQIATRPEWSEFRHRPMFLLVAAQR